MSAPDRGSRSVAIIGLPASGKTTFLAALWHLVTSRDVPLSLRFGALNEGDRSYLNSIAERWARAEVQERTKMETVRLVSMNFVTDEGESLDLTFPDVSGESFRRMWGERDIETLFAEALKERSVLLFVHSDSIVAPRWVVDSAALSSDIGVEVPDEEAIPWDPGLAPTQVKLVGLLQLLRMQPLDVGERRLAIVLSAWDKGMGEGLEPSEFLKQKLPLLHQYLYHGADGWDWRVYGVSAQGGVYDDPDKSEELQSEEAERLRSLAVASERIKLVDGESESHDLTAPIAWLIE